MHAQLMIRQGTPGIPEAEYASAIRVAPWADNVEAPISVSFQLALPDGDTLQSFKQVLQLSCQLVDTLAFETPFKNTYFALRTPPP